MMASSTNPQSHNQQILDADPINKFKVLIPHLKDSLENLMKSASEVIHCNSQVENIRSGERTAQFEKSIERFYAICDQIEMNLHLALECAQQNIDSQRHTPLSVQSSTPKADSHQQEAQPYSRFLSTVKKQIHCAKEIYDALIECSKRISDSQLTQPMDT